LILVNIDYCISIVLKNKKYFVTNSCDYVNVKIDLV